MARNWLVDGRTIAKKVKNPTWSAASQSQGEESESNHDCPNCHHPIKNNYAWPGLPAGVKFDPSDAELLEHLAAKCSVGDAMPHAFIDEFIPTLEQDQGICYTHPKNLPGAKKDGSSVHFFHRTVNAYSTGQRKRRKIQPNLTTEDVRWHKTGRTKPVTENGFLKGWKKIMVLYKSSKKGAKPDKSNWVMHQYHLGAEEEEREGEYVVSKILYQQQKQNDMDDGAPATDYATPGPKTPKTSTPPLLVCKSSPIDDDCKGWLAGESQAYEETEYPTEQDLLLCKEMINNHSLSNDQGLNQIFGTVLTNKIDEAAGTQNIPCGLSDLEKLDFDTPPDFMHPDLQLGSQESIYDWLDLM